jgi:hypothetical protein
MKSILFAFMMLSAGFEINPKSTLFEINDPVSKGKGCNCSDKKGTIVQCNGKFDKCKLDRKKATYLFEFAKSDSPKRLKLEVSKGSEGKSTLTYTGRIYLIDKQSEGQYVVKIPTSINKSYSWDDTTREDFLVFTYDTKAKDIKIEAQGKMANFVDKDHGYTFAKIKADLLELCSKQPFEGKNVAKAASAYFILEYTKAMKQ